ncbi:MAG: exonuclease domain-containing protein [bacterium]|nr:exonuclease domain-containing protein [bacterium]MDD5756258.1 exonuclease domain-containing protein [bacterium]
MLKMKDVTKKISESTFVFFDVETTGMSPACGHRICELALVQWQGGKVVATFHSLINPGRPISPAASAINCITDSMVAQAPYFHEVAGDILRFIRETIIVGHNVSFDLSFLNSHLRNIDLPEVDNTVLDTLALARRCYNFPSNSLGNIAKALTLPIQAQHRALDDALLTKDIFTRFMQDFQGKNISEIGQLIELQGGEITVPSLYKPVLPTALSEALKNKTPVFVRYKNEYDEEIQRIVEPLQVKIEGQDIYLVATCQFREMELVIRLDQIMEMKILPVAPVQELA